MIPRELEDDMDGWMDDDDAMAIMGMVWCARESIKVMIINGVMMATPPSVEIND